MRRYALVLWRFRPLGGLPGEDVSGWDVERVKADGSREFVYGAHCFRDALYMRDLLRSMERDGYFSEVA